MATGDEYLEYHNEALERTAKSWSALLGAFLCEMVDFELIIRTAVRDYHVYKDSWTLTVSEGFVCYQDRNNEHD